MHILIKDKDGEKRDQKCEDLRYADGVYLMLFDRKDRLIAIYFKPQWFEILSFK